MIVKWKIKAAREDDSYWGIFHFYFDSNGKISRHVFETVDHKFDPKTFAITTAGIEWVVRKARGEHKKELGWCFRRLTPTERE